MDTVIFIFFLPLFLMPFWNFLIPPALAAIVCVVFWRRRAFRNTVIVMSLALGIVIEVPLLVLYMSFFATVDDGETRLNAYFPDAISSPCCVVQHRFQIAGLGDTKDYWKLQDIDPNDCRQIIQQYNLEPIHRERPFSFMNHPWWWPRSTRAYAVYQADDVDGGCIELWMQKKSSSVYLFKFTE